MASSVYNSTCGLNIDSHSSVQISSASVKTFRSFSSAEGSHELGNDGFPSPPSSQDLSSVTSISLQSASEDLDIYEHQSTEALITTVSNASSFELRRDSLAGSYSSSRNPEALIISSANTQFYSVTRLMEQEDEEPVPETSEWRDLLDALEIERSRASVFHSMTPMERFLSNESVEGCSVELRIWGTEE